MDAVEFINDEFFNDEFIRFEKGTGRQVNCKRK